MPWAGNTRFRRRTVRPLFDLMSLFVNNLVRHPPPNGNKLFSILWDLKMRFSLERADTYSQRIKFKSFTRWHYLAATNWWSLKFAWINYCRASAAVKSTVAQFMTTPNSGPALPLSYFAWSQLLLAHVFRQLLCCFLFIYFVFIYSFIWSRNASIDRFSLFPSKFDSFLLNARFLIVTFIDPLESLSNVSNFFFKLNIQFATCPFDWILLFRLVTF